jgi:hypothetical protein
VKDHNFPGAEAMSMKPIRRRTHSRHVANQLSTALVIVAAIVLGNAAASAQVMIVQSSAKGLTAGTTLESNATITIPKGGKATFILPSGATRTISGPFTGKAAELTKGVKTNPSVWAAIKRYVVTGGSTGKYVGATRSLAPIAMAKPLPFSWRDVPLSTNGDYCVEKNAKVSLVRKRTAKAQSLTIVEMKSKRRANIRFAVGETSLPWPAELTLQPGVTYALLFPNRPSHRQIRLRMIAPLPPREDTLQVLHGQRCESQMRAFIRQLQNAD